MKPAFYSRTARKARDRRVRFQRLDIEMRKRIDHLDHDQSETNHPPTQEDQP